MKTLVVGDIHGCFVELMKLMQMAGLRDEDRLVSVGDLTCRGPEPVEVLRCFMRRPNTDAVMGNQEWKQVQGKSGDARDHVRRTCGEVFYAEALEWMSRLSLYLELDGFVVVHWGLEPGIALNDQRRKVMLGLPGGERHLAKVLDGKQWYDAYDGEAGVIYGHHRWGAGVRRDLTYGLDTGCVYGKELTGLLLPERRLISVPARENHWKRQRADILG